MNFVLDTSVLRDVSKSGGDNIEPGKKSIPANYSHGWVSFVRLHSFSLFSRRMMQSLDARTPKAKKVLYGLLELLLMSG